MNVLFLTITAFDDISHRGIYQDLFRKFVTEGHKVFVVFPKERRYGIASRIVKQGGATLLGVKTLNLQKTNLVEKGIGMVMLEFQFKSAIRKYFEDVDFDMILYSTPPVTFSMVIRYLKTKNPGVITYLLLKDIFPQNAVDLGMMGPKSLVYRFFRNKEKRLYALSDYIGCMSPANVKYVLSHNPEIPVDRVELAPNSYEALEPVIPSINQRDAIRLKYGLPLDRYVFVYGGNLGKPQGIPFLIDCLNANSSRDDCFFVVVGTGTELPILKTWFADKHPRSVIVLDGLPRSDYDELVCSCDVGLIFLDHRFTIPNFPSRMLSYLERKMPILCATDPNTDIGRIAEENGFGYWCESNSVEAFTVILDKMIYSDKKMMGEKGFDYLEKNYRIENTYNAILSHV